MNPLRILGHEHGLIRQYLDCLRYAVDRLERGERPPAELFENAIIFAREFTDRYHHHKEEEQMFRLLAEAVGGELDGAIATLRFQHERGRALVNAIADALPGYAEGHDHRKTVLMENIAAFCSLLHEHINREDHYFYPLVKEVLTEDGQHALLVEFERAEDNLGPGFFDESVERVEKMARLVRE